MSLCSNWYSMCVCGCVAVCMRVCSCIIVACAVATHCPLCCLWRQSWIEGPPILPSSPPEVGSFWTPKAMHAQYRSWTAFSSPSYTQPLQAVFPQNGSTQQGYLFCRKWHFHHRMVQGKHSIVKQWWVHCRLFCHHRWWLDEYVSYINMCECRNTATLYY